MEIRVLTSGSSGNVTAIEVGGKIILVDCGKSGNWILAHLNYKLPQAILVTHEHGDHSKAVTNFLKRGVDVYLTQGTKEALSLGQRHNLHKITASCEFETCEAKVLPIMSIHDAAEPVNFILQDATDRILYVTDTGAVPAVTGVFTKIIIETNFSEPALLASAIEEPQKRRVLENHLSVEQAIKFLKKYPDADVHLVHISKRHGDKDEFKARVIAETRNINVFAD